MTKELDYKKLKAELIGLLEGYLKNPRSKEIQEKLSKLWEYYFNTFPFMKKEIEDALGIGENFLCRIKPSKKRLKQIIEKLKSTEF